MKKKILLFLLLAGAAGCFDKKQQSIVKADPSMDKAKVDEFANEDFQSVLQGRLPVHAIRDSQRPDLSDGGTTFYKTSSYTLEIRKRLSEANGKKGYMYGPIIVFKTDSNVVTPKEISNIKFYTIDELDELTKHSQR